MERVFSLETHTNLSSEGLTVTEYITEDTDKTVWIIDIPKHQPRLPVYAHKKLWQRVGDSLTEEEFSYLRKNKS